MHSVEQYVGQVLDGKYSLERLLGQGGMGAVYLAVHLGTERFVALKLIAPEFMREQEFVQRFKREARAAGRLRHPNVVDVTDFGFASVEGEPVAYLVMEYLDGCTLADVLREEHKLQTEWVVDILEQVCSALQEAHTQGIVHRDLKPENIWLEPNRLGSYRVKVLDFGIAKLASTALPEGVQTELIARPGALLPTKHDDDGESEAETLIYRSSSLRAGVMESLPETEGVSEPGRADLATRIRAAPKGLFSQPHSSDEGKTVGLEQPTLRAKSAAQITLAAGSGQSTELTRVGAIMGTPTYMSPEQWCRLPNRLRMAGAWWRLRRSNSQKKRYPSGGQSF